jgi:Domain of unknown function (DUF4337)
MKKNSQRKSKPKAPQKAVAAVQARRSGVAPAQREACDPSHGLEKDERKIGVISGTPADTFDETAERKHDKFIAIYISILAVLIALAATGSNDAMKTAQQAGFQVNDQYAFYQAKYIRQSQIKLASDQLELKMLETKDPNGTSDIARKIQASRAEYDKEIARLETNARNGKKELLARAQNCENTRNVALAQHPFYDYSLAMLQIAIVLASASIITGRKLLLWGSGGVGMFGVLLFLNGYTLVYGLPPQHYEKTVALQKSLPWIQKFKAPIIASCPLD